MFTAHCHDYMTGEELNYRQRHGDKLMALLALVAGAGKLAAEAGINSSSSSPAVLITDDKYVRWGVGRCIRLHQAASGCIRLHQATSGCLSWRHTSTSVPAIQPVRLYGWRPCYVSLFRSSAIRHACPALPRPP